MRRRHSILFSFVVTLFALVANAQTADLLISKSATEAATAGDAIDYSIFVINNGPSDAQNVSVTDTLPAGTTFVSLFASTTIFACTTPAVGAGGTVTCTAPAFNNQAETSFTLTVKTSASAPTGNIRNTATITSSTADPNSSDNSSSVTTGITGNAPAAADLSIESINGSSTVNSGGTMSFRVAIANKGPSSAHHVQLVNAVPANATFLSVIVADPIGEFTCATPSFGTTGNITCSVPTFDQRGISDQPAFLFTFRVNNGVAAGTVLTNTASLSGDESDPNSSNNTASRSTTTASQATSADVSVATTGGGSEFTVTVRNNGPNDAATVTLTDSVPSGSTFAGWEQTNGPAFTCSTPSPGSTGNITCSIGVLPGFDTQITTAVFDLTLNNSGQVTNNVTVSSPTPDPRPDNNSSTFPPSARLTIDNVSVIEGNSGTTSAVFTVRLQPPNAVLTATVNYHASGITATPGADFIASEGTLTFRAGETVKSITVQVLGDTLNEGNELFVVQLTDPVNAALDQDLGIGTIVDDDNGQFPVPPASIDNLTVTEGNSGTTNATFTARLSITSAAVSRVRWQTQDGTALAGSDYIASSGEVIFQPGELSKTFTVPIIGDTIFEPDEVFNVIITGTDNASFTAQPATCLIRNDDVQPPSRHRAIRP
jgi:uncharacterized repeat protein (TIGR01451 family)